MWNGIHTVFFGTGIIFEITQLRNCHAVFFLLYEYIMEKVLSLILNL